MAVYYIDPVNGNDGAEGLCPDCAKKDYEKLSILPGDTVLFKRGSVYRDKLRSVGGTEEAPVTYGAYGEGESPVFCGSVDVSSPADWEEAAPNIWRCLKAVPGEVGNFVFNEDECTAAFRWEKNELSQQGDFWDARFYGDHWREAQIPAQEILLWSEKNPGEYYSHIECVPYGQRNLGDLVSNLVLEDLCAKNSGVHGFTGSGRNITIRRCQFKNIGGCAWSAKLRIRFGNAVELWTYGDDILVEDCFFKNVYDSCVTQQGPGKDTIPAKNFICRRNVFDTYGMAAFEYRDKLPAYAEFTDNVCKNAGCGFAMLGIELPRQSEIWPQPMGHHIFLWRIDGAEATDELRICGNDFGPAPVGAAIYSIIAPEAEAQMVLENNAYTPNDVMINHFAGKSWNDFDAYRKATGKDLTSVLKEA